MLATEDVDEANDTTRDAMGVLVGPEEFWGLERVGLLPVGDAVLVVKETDRFAIEVTTILLVFVDVGWELDLDLPV